LLVDPNEIRFRPRRLSALCFSGMFSFSVVVIGKSSLLRLPMSKHERSGARFIRALRPRGRFGSACRSLIERPRLWRVTPEGAAGLT
jgi:hypothetical protein